MKAIAEISDRTEVETEARVFWEFRAHSIDKANCVAN
jgi:hypothetical protein